jgi:hypothetical protein
VTLDTRVDATYDLRPPLPLLGVYLLPFSRGGLSVDASPGAEDATRVKALSLKS